MPIDLCSSIKKTSQWAFGSPVLNGILSSSVFVAIVISLLMIILIMVMYPAKSGTPFSILMKMFIYMVFGTLLIVFLHDSVLKFTIVEELEGKEADAFMQNATLYGRQQDPSYGSLYREIIPSNQSVQINQPAQIPAQIPAPAQTPASVQTGAYEPSDTLRLNNQTLGGFHAPKSGGNPFK